MDHFARELERVADPDTGIVIHWYSSTIKMEGGCKSCPSSEALEK